MVIIIFIFIDMISNGGILWFIKSIGTSLISFVNEQGDIVILFVRGSNNKLLNLILLSCTRPSFRVLICRLKFGWWPAMTFACCNSLDKSPRIAI